MKPCRVCRQQTVLHLHSLASFQEQVDFRRTTVCLTCVRFILIRSLVIFVVLMCSITIIIWSNCSVALLCSKHDMLLCERIFSMGPDGFECDNKSFMTCPFLTSRTGIAFWSYLGDRCHEPLINSSFQSHHCCRPVFLKKLPRVVPDLNNFFFFEHRKPCNACTAWA